MTRNHLAKGTQALIITIMIQFSISCSSPDQNQRSNTITPNGVAKPEETSQPIEDTEALQQESPVITSTGSDGRMVLGTNSLEWDAQTTKSDLSLSLTEVVAKEAGTHVTSLSSTFEITVTNEDPQLASPVGTMTVALSSPKSETTVLKAVQRKPDGQLIKFSDVEILSDQQVKANVILTSSHITVVQVDLIDPNQPMLDLTNSDLGDCQVYRLDHSLIPQPIDVAETIKDAIEVKCSEGKTTLQKLIWIQEKTASTGLWQFYEVQQNEEGRPQLVLKDFLVETVVGEQHHLITSHATTSTQLVLSHKEGASREVSLNLVGPNKTTYKGGQSFSIRLSFSDRKGVPEPTKNDFVLKSQEQVSADLSLTPDAEAYLINLSNLKGEGYLDIDLSEEFKSRIAGVAKIMKSYSTPFKIDTLVPRAITLSTQLSSDAQALNVNTDKVNEAFPKNYHWQVCEGHNSCGQEICVTSTTTKVDTAIDISHVAGFANYSVCLKQEDELGQFSAQQTINLNKTPTISSCDPAKQVWQMSNDTGYDADGNEFIKAMHVDLIGNIYIVGTTNGSLFEANAGSNDIFYAKFSPSCSLVYGKQIGQTTGTTFFNGGSADQDDSIYDESLRVGPDGNLYVAGYTKSSLGEANKQNSTPVNTYDAFWFKFDKDTGAILMMKQIGETTSAAKNIDASANDYCESFVVREDGVYLHIQVYNNYTNIANNFLGGGDLALVKYNHAGEIVYARHYGANESSFTGTTTSNDDIYTMINAPDGKIIFAGSTKTLMTGNTDTSKYDIFYGKFNPANGDIEYIKSVNSTLPLVSNSDADEGANYLEVDASGNYFIAGTTKGAFTEGASGDLDTIVMKFSPNGTMLWAFHLGGTSGGTSLRDSPKEIRLHNGFLYVTGITRGNLNGTHSDGDGSKFDGFVLKLNASTGALVSKWHLNTDNKDTYGVNATTGSDGPDTIYIDQNNHIYIGGVSSGDFKDVNADSDFDVYLMKLDLSLIFP